MVRERKGRRDLFYGSLVGSGKYKPAVLFPEFYPEEEVEEQASPGGDVDYDYSEVKWQTPGESGLDEFTKMQEMMRDSGIAVLESDEEGLEEASPEITGEVEEQESAEWI